MKLKIAVFGVIAACVAMTGCAERPQAGASLSEVCRPESVAPAQLRIGDLVVPRDQLVAQLQHSPISAEYGVSINLSEDYASAIAQMTREKIGLTLPLYLDDELIAEPVVNTPILGGRVLISGNYTRSAASDIVARLSGPCPVQNGN